MKQLSMFAAPENKNNTGPASSDQWKLFIDGASRSNPGQAGAGFCIYKNGIMKEQRGFYLGIKTNNQAEYYALLIGLFFVKKHMHESDQVIIVSDSQLLTRQFEGAYKIKNPGLKPLHACARTMLAGMRYRFEHVLREDNSEADAMANHGIDTKEAVPDAFIHMLEECAGI